MKKKVLLIVTLFVLLILAGPQPHAKASANSWSPTGSMITGRYGQTATRLNNGEVLVAGGIDSNDQYLASAELYNPQTGMWSSTGDMVSPRLAATATLLGNGKVLIAGGLSPNIGSTTTAELYDPQAGTWSPT